MQFTDPESEFPQEFDLVRDDEFDRFDDGQLLEMVREGRSAAYASLFSRYRHPAQRLARYLSRTNDVDDIVAEAFAGVLDQLLRGRGPERAFRAYLFTSIRHGVGRRAKSRQRVVPTGDVTMMESRLPPERGELDGFERELVWAAFETLPARWRTVLWHIDVDRRRPSEIAPILELTPNGVSALAYRAREGLRTAYVAQHVADGNHVGTRCREVRHQLAALVRHKVRSRDAIGLHAHLESCTSCTAVFGELEDVNEHVRDVTLS